MAGLQLGLLPLRRHRRRHPRLCRHPCHPLVLLHGAAQEVRWARRQVLLLLLRPASTLGCSCWSPGQGCTGGMACPQPLPRHPQRHFSSKCEEDHHVQGTEVVEAAEDASKADEAGARPQ